MDEAAGVCRFCGLPIRTGDDVDRSSAAHVACVEASGLSDDEQDQGRRRQRAQTMVDASKLRQPFIG